MCNGYYLFPDSVLKFIVLPPSSNDKLSFKLKKNINHTTASYRIIP